MRSSTLPDPYRVVVKSQLSPARQQLLRILQRLNFGRIEGLVVLNGEPQFDPAPRLVRDIKLCGDSDPRPEARAEDFILKAAQVEFFDRLDRGGSFTIEVLEVKHGVPFRMSVEEPSS